MIIHIIKNNELLSDIIKNYGITKSDLMGNNKHITDFSNLIPGMKLKIPFLNEETIQILESSEPFISDYAPSIDKYEKKEVSNTVEPLDEIKSEDKEKVEEKSFRGIRYVAPPNNPFYKQNIWPPRRRR